MTQLFDEIEKLNSEQKLYFIRTQPISKKIFLKPLEKAQSFLSNKFPKDFHDFYSTTIDLKLCYMDKSGDWDPNRTISAVCWLEKMFDKFKQHPEPFTEKQKDYIKVKASYPCSKWFPSEFKDHKLFNEISRQKVLIEIEGTTGVISVDFYTESKNGYVLKYFDARNPESICEIHLTLPEFLNYYIYFGTFDHWFFAFTKKGMYTLKNINQIKQEFGKLNTHKQKIVELEQRIKP
ncbi:MAG: hypothetical protein RLZZ262_2488 [Bacteroidota bacterium]